jgi:hypothetical protein
MTQVNSDSDDLSQATPVTGHTNNGEQDQELSALTSEKATQEEQDYTHDQSECLKCLTWRPTCLILLTPKLI